MSKINLENNFSMEKCFICDPKTMEKYNSRLILLLRFFLLLFWYKTHLLHQYVCYRVQIQKSQQKKLKLTKLDLLNNHFFMKINAVQYLNNLWQGRLLVYK